MIPTMIGIGLVGGRWWRSVLLLAAVGWPLVLIAGGVTTDVGSLLGGAVAAVVNTAVGVVVHQGLRWVVGRAVG